MQNGNSITDEVVVDADRETVFRALTDADEIERWWATRAESEPRVGGRFRYEWEFPDAPERDHEQSGTYEEIEAGERVAYPWKVGDGTTRVAFELSDAGEEGTRVRLNHTGWTEAMAGAREPHEQGWGMFLQNLKNVLEGREDVRAAAVGMRVMG